MNSQKKTLKLRAEKIAKQNNIIFIYQFIKTKVTT